MKRLDGAHDSLTFNIQAKFTLWITRNRAHIKSRVCAQDARCLKLRRQHDIREQVHAQRETRRVLGDGIRKKMGLVNADRGDSRAFGGKRQSMGRHGGRVAALGARVGSRVSARTFS